MQARSLGLLATLAAILAVLLLLRPWEGDREANDVSGASAGETSPEMLGAMSPRDGLPDAERATLGVADEVGAAAPPPSPWPLLIKAVWADSHFSLGWPPRTRDPRVGQPAAAGTSLSVWVVRGGQRTRLGSATLDAEGKATLDVAQLRSWGSLRRRGTEIHVQANDPAMHLHPGNSLGSRSHYCSLPEKDGESGSPLQIDVGVLLGPLLTGRCVDPEGRPVQYAHVELQPAGAGDERSPREACTDARGRFAISLPSPGTHKMDVLMPRGALSGEFPNIMVKADGDTDVGDLLLTHVLGHHGTVRRTSGASISGLGVSLSGESLLRLSWYPDRHPAGCGPVHSVHYKPSTRTLRDGSFRLPFLILHKDVEVVLDTRPGFGVEITRKKKSGYTVVEGQTDFTVKGHRLRLHVVDPEGHAVVGSRVSVAGYAKGKKPAAWRDYKWHDVTAGPGGVLDLWGAPGSCIAVDALDITEEALTDFVLPDRTWSSNARLVVLRPRK